MKLLVWTALVLIVVWWLLRPRHKDAGASTESGAALPRGEPMVRCLHCGVHLPQSEAVAGQAGPFCSEDHRLQHASR